MHGIVTRYRKHDCTIVALALARQMQMAAHRFNIFTYDWRADNIDETFDNKVIRTKLHKISQNTQFLVWTAPADASTVRLFKNKGINSILYTGLDQICPDDGAALSEYNTVLMPSYNQAASIHNYFKINNLSSLIFAPDWPITTKQLNLNKHIRLFLSLYGSQRQRVDQIILSILDNILYKHAKVLLTVCGSGGLTRKANNLLNELSSRYSSRVRIHSNVSWNQHIVEMSKSDLTLWPACSDTFGIVGLTSLAVGTPVLAWNISPINEYLVNTRNSILVDCDAYSNSIGCMTAKPDWKAYCAAITNLVSDEARLNELQQRTSEYTYNIKTNFDQSWQSLIPPTF